MSNNIKVGFSATDAGYTSTVKKINDSTKTIDDNVKKVSGSVTSSFASMVKAGAGLAVGFGAIKAAGALVREVFEGFGEALDLGGQLKDLSDRTGESAGNLMLLQRAFENTGSSAEKVGPSINKLQKFMDDAAQGGKSQTETLLRLGISLEELKGKTPIEQMQVFAERISAVEIDAERSALAIKVFGKSGGELLPLLRNMSGELETAKGQLGSMPDIMTRLNKVFDDVGDNITIIKGKFMEFAAGLLSKVAPALEFITTAMTGFDAAAFGERVGQALIGAGQGMQAFKSAMDALALGEFKLAMEIAFNAIRLTAAESFNSILNYAKATFAAIGEFLKAVLGPDSGAFTFLSHAFDMLGLRITKSFTESFAEIVSIIPGVGEKMAAALGEKINILNADIETKSGQMKNALGQIPTDLVWGFEDAGEKFKETLKTSEDFINTQEIIKENQKLLAQLEEKKAASIREQGLQAEKYDFKRITLQEQYQKTLKVIADLEEQIKEAKMLGDDNKVKQLERQLALEKLIAEEIKNGKTYQEALAIATDKQNNADANILANKKDQTKEMQAQLSLSQQMQGDLDKRAAEEQVDPGGRTRSKFEEALAKGRPRQAQRQIEKMQDQERRSNIKDMFKELTGETSKLNKSTRDMAKELGIDVTGKKKRDLENEIQAELKKRKEKDKPGKEGEKEPAKPKEKQDPNTGVLQSILTEVTGIGKKLPVTALGY
jgi:hypothetical protein